MACGADSPLDEEVGLSGGACFCEVGLFEGDGNEEVAGIVEGEERGGEVAGGGNGVGVSGWVAGLGVGREAADAGVQLLGGDSEVGVDGVGMGFVGGGPGDEEFAFGVDHGEAEVDEVLFGEAFGEEGAWPAGEVFDCGGEGAACLGGGLGGAEEDGEAGEEDGGEVGSGLADGEGDAGEVFGEGDPRDEIVDLFDAAEGAAEGEGAVVFAGVVFEGEGDDVAAHGSTDEVGALGFAELVGEVVCEGEGVVGADAGDVAVFGVGAGGPGEAVGDEVFAEGARGIFDGDLGAEAGESVGVEDEFAVPVFGDFDAVGGAVEDAVAGAGAGDGFEGGVGGCGSDAGAGAEGAVGGWRGGGGGGGGRSACRGARRGAGCAGRGRAIGW